MKFLIALLCLLSFASHSAEVPHWDVDRLNQVSHRDGHTFKHQKSWVTDSLKNGVSLKHLTGLMKPRIHFGPMKYDNLQSVVSLPAHYDVREKMPLGKWEVRNQGQCGSCWAFSVTGVLEGLLRMKSTPVELNLAEQFLVSCSRYNCSGGYFDAFNYLVNPGSPLESSFPYTARNSRCVSGLRPAGKIVKWSYVGNGRVSPTTEQVKQAILTYGPVSVTVDGSFSSYASGVYNRCSTAQTNHMVVLVGWDDSTQSWIMRNSWGSSWGENGYMRIKYVNSRGQRCNNIAEMAAYATLE